MRSGKTLILATKEFAKENKGKSWLYLVSTAFFLIIAQIGTIYGLHVDKKAYLYWSASSGFSFDARLPGNTPVKNPTKVEKTIIPIINKNGVLKRDIDAAPNERAKILIPKFTITSPT